MNEMLSGLNGTQQFIFEYLAEEVFRRQPEETREFLLRTSVLSQMDAAACNALTGMPEAPRLSCSSWKSRTCSSPA